MAEKYALLIGIYDYQDSSLGKLFAPKEDVDKLYDVLTDDNICGFKKENVKCLLNSSHSTLHDQIVDFFDHRTVEDTVLMYFSGHGLLDERGQLYLATIEAKRDKPHVYTVSADDIMVEMDSCGAKKQILILDCCHSGAFINAIKGQNMPSFSAEGISGQGRFVLTASDRVQEAYENLNESSIFTHALVEGLRTGQADHDGDGIVSFDEWFAHAKEQVHQKKPTQTPGKFTYMADNIEIAKACPANMKFLNGRYVATSIKVLDEILKDITVCTQKKVENETKYENLEDFSIFKAFPYEEQMGKAWTKKGENNAFHIQNAIAFMNQILIAGKREVAKKGAEDDFWRQHLENQDDVEFKTFIRDAMDEFKENRNQIEPFLRIAAFYHDIGKYINRERHPTIGWYIVQNLEPDERRALETILDGDNVEEEKLSLFRLLMVILRDHDQFGVLSTGEASYPILLNSITHSDDVDDQIKIITALMLLNLADIAATVPVLSEEIIEKLKQDYEWFTENLRTYARIKTEASSRRKDGGSGPSTNVGIESFDDFVIRVSSQEDRVCKRIHRLVTTTVEDLINLDLSQYKEDDWIKDVKAACPFLTDELKGLRDIRLVRDAYHTVFSSDTSRREFASVFTHICKMDYGKRFLNRLIGYWIIEASNQKEAAKKQREEAEKRKEKSKAKEPQPIDAVYRLFAVLRRITGTYEAMVHSSGNLSGSLIGVEMKDLAPKDAPEKPWTIAQLIAENHYPGLTWMMSDTPAWYF
jgi:hypothetical protein